MRSLSRSGLLAVAALAACNQIIGLDPGLDKPVGSGGSGGATSSSSGSGGQGGAASSSSSGGMDGGGGTPMVCTPSETKACTYSGPPGTADVGNCKTPTQTCAADGSGFGPCEGEVLPGVESCTTKGDEDCDGIACSEVVWTKIVGDMQDQSVTSVAVDATGNVIAAGWAWGTTAFGASTVLVSAGKEDVFVTKLSRDGQFLWSVRAGDGSSQFADAVAVDANGDIVVAGHFSGLMPFGPTSGMSQLSDVFVAKLAAADGHPLWAVSFGNSVAQHLGGVATTPNGDVIITGDYLGNVTFGTTMLSNASTFANAFVARLAGATGSAVWANSYADANAMGNTVGQAVAVSKTGEIFVGGQFGGSMTSFGGATFAGIPARSTFLLKLNSLGGHVWSKAFIAGPGAPASRLGSIAVAPTGDVVIAGQAGQGVDYGGGPTTTGGLFAARFDAAGNHKWASVFGGSGPYAISVAVDAADKIALAGSCSGIVNFGVNLSSANAMGNSFLAKLDPAGNHLWSKMFADAAAADVTHAIAVDQATGRLIIGGEQLGTVDYGGGMVMPAGGKDGFIASFQP